MNTQHKVVSLQQKMEDKRAVRLLCSEAVDQQVQRGEAENGQLRNRRRHLTKQVLKRVPLSAQRSPRKLLHAASMVLAMWGFVGLTMPQAAEAAPLFQHNMLDGFNVGYRATPTFADIDGDGDLDAFVGESLGTVKFYRNNGTNLAPTFVADTAGNPLAGFNVGRGAAPTFADIDGDGDLDAFVGESLGTVKFYRNNGTNLAPTFVPDVAGNPLAGFNVGRSAAPTFADIDGDGDLDAFVGEPNGIVKFYRNNGTNLAPVFAADVAGNPLAGFDVGSNAAPTFADIDGDGDLDAFVGGNTGTVNLFKNIDPSPTAVADTLNTFVNTAATTGDVTLNDVFKVDGPSANFPVTAFDPASVQGGTVTNNGNNTFTYLPAVGFSGTDNFTYTLSDGAGNTAVGTVNVTVAVDTIAPVITAPTNLTITATSSTGIALTDATVAAYLAGVTVTDNVGVTSTTHNAPATLPVGVTTVTFTASDGAGNTSTATGTVTVTAFVSGTTTATTGSGGGCAISPNQSFDPLLPLLIIAGLFMPWVRRKHG